ncbi:MAG: PQQ-binding-like beta-propeller repeat protein [Candidatus Sabulitectum sp.]|nr:PQQ-binding-like beta-propeller repeat protein [Candidatus Sabulitectum sp.]
MLFIMMALFGSVTVNEVSLDASILENMQDEWIAPGYRVEEEIIIDPLDYGVPQDDRDGNPRIIGFQSFFVQTPEGEKWRIVLTYDRKIVVLQEDAEQREFEVERSIAHMINSKDGRFVLLGLQEEEDTRTEYERAISGIYYLPPEKRSVLIDIDTGTQVSKPGIAGIGYLGGNGYGIASYGDSIRFYNDNLVLVKQLFNRIANISNGFTSYSADGSLLVTNFCESWDKYSDEQYVMRAYDNRGNILWDVQPPNAGVPAVSADGSLVLVIAGNRVLCLDGGDGSLLWEEHFENQVGISCAGRNGASMAFETDLPPEGVRDSPGRERFLYVVTDNADGNIRLSRISFFSRNIGFFSCLTVNESGSSLWRTYFGQSPGINLSKYELCLFTETGDLVFVHRIDGHGNIRNGLWRNTMDLKPNSIDPIGNRIIWFEESFIHILTLQKEGISE